MNCYDIVSALIKEECASCPSKLIVKQDNRAKLYDVCMLMDQMRDRFGAYSVSVAIEKSDTLVVTMVLNSDFVVYRGDPWFFGDDRLFCRVSESASEIRFSSGPEDDQPAIGFAFNSFFIEEGVHNE